VNIARRCLPIFVLLSVLLGNNLQAMQRYVLSAFRSQAERVLWLYAIQRPDISELANVLGDSNLNPNFTTMVWDGTWPERYESMTPLAMTVVRRNIPSMRALMASSKVDVDCGGYTALQHGGVEVTCLDRAARLVQDMQRRIAAIQAVGIDPSVEGGHLGESLQRELNVQRRIAQLLDEAGGASSIFTDEEIECLLYGAKGIE